MVTGLVTVNGNRETRLSSTYFVSGLAKSIIGPSFFLDRGVPLRMIFGREASVIDKERASLGRSSEVS
jgi:hypothetical protein